MEKTSFTLDTLGQLDPQMAEAIRLARCILSKDIPLMIQGETGSGKEVFAQAFHCSSTRAQAPFVAVNCAAIPANLIEAELFGYVEGAFTGANRQGSPGKLREAHGGTLFLDEIGDMPLALQVVLLRVLETRKVSPLGGGRETPLDIALICASHRPIKALVRQGSFRADLYYRLNGLTIQLPPLRDRTDFAVLCRSIICKLAEKRKLSISPDALRTLAKHSWPGNIRQLYNLLRVAVAMMGEETVLTTAHLPAEMLEEERLQPVRRRKLRSAEQDIVQAAVARHGGNISAAARELGITRTTLYRKLKQDQT